MTQYRKTPLYGNCLIVAPDGEALCRTNQKKINWYLERGLADLVDGAECPTIRLRFEPSGRKGANHPYIVAVKKNRCVCCGSNKYITRHHVVPYCFRKYFPVEIKDHALHDVVPLCIPCHEEYESHAGERKKELAEELGIPVHGKNAYCDKSLYGVRGAGNALMRFRDSIPEHRQQFLIDVLRAHFGKQEITEEDIYNASKVKPMVHGPDYVPYGKCVVDAAENLQSFIIEWRKHFIEKMQPKHLPEFWDINHEI